MKLIDNLKATLTTSYTAWAVYLGAAAQLLLEYGLGSALPGWATLLLLALILLGRVLKQDSVSGAKEETKDDASLGLGA